MCNVQTKVIPLIIGGDWNHLKITPNTRMQNSGKARSYGSTENSHKGHCTHTAGSANVEAKKHISRAK
jgi:hypothetical protein